MIDLHVLLLRNGQLKLLDSQKDVVTHDWGIATFDADSIVRFGLNTWGWTVSTVTTGQGLFLQNQSFYAFVDGKIVSLGEYEAKEDDSGALERGFHSITSRFLLKDTLTESLSPLTIHWTHELNGRRTNRLITSHSYKPGLGYQIADIRQRLCSH